MQNTITEVKSSLEAANNRMQDAEERVSEVEDKLVEIKTISYIYRLISKLQNKCKPKIHN